MDGAGDFLFVPPDLEEASVPFLEGLVTAAFPLPLPLGFETGAAVLAAGEADFRVSKELWDRKGAVEVAERGS